MKINPCNFSFTLQQILSTVNPQQTASISLIKSLLTAALQHEQLHKAGIMAVMTIMDQFWREGLTGSTCYTEGAHAAKRRKYLLHATHRVPCSRASMTQ